MLALIHGASWAEVLLAGATTFASLGVLYTARQVREGRKARVAEIVNDLAQRWEAPPMVEARGKVAESQTVQELQRAVRRAFRKRTPDYWIFTRYINFFEQVGLAFKDHDVGLKVVDSALGGTIRDAWVSWRVVIPEVWGWESRVGEAFGELARKLEQREHRRHAKRALIRLFKTEDRRW